MDPVVPLVLSHGWAAGVNAYLTVLLVCLTGRIGLADVPATFERTDVLVAAAVLTAVEFVVDKVPYLDSLWDAGHTFIQPAIAAALGVEIAGEAGAGDTALAGAGSGVAALASHAVKAGLRLAVNASPEPFTNVGVSLGEDGAVSLVSYLAVEAPWVAFGLAMGLLVIGATLVVLLARQIRRGVRRLEARGAGARGP